MSKEAKLKPCPFCGGKAEVLGGSWNMCIQCKKWRTCGAWMTHFRKKTAINRRYYSIIY